MRRHFLPSKTVKTSWIRRNPVGTLETVPSPEKYLACGEIRRLFTLSNCQSAVVGRHIHTSKGRNGVSGTWQTNSPEWCYKALRINAHFKSLEGGTWQDIVLNLRDSATEDQKLPDNISPDTSTSTNSSFNHKVVVLLVLPRLEQLTKFHLQRLWRCGLAVQVTWLSCQKNLL